MARAAHSLNVLLNQLNTLAPNRSKASDGWIGDPAHASRDSDHNPDAAGVVHARDYTHHPAGGLNCHTLAGALAAHRDGRIKYVIWDRRIMSGAGGPSPWVWRAYTGANQHTQHLHLSVVSGAAGDNTAAWAGITPTEAPEVALKDETIKFWQDAGNPFGGTPGDKFVPADQVLGWIHNYTQGAWKATARMEGVLQGVLTALAALQAGEEIDLAAIRQAAEQGATAALERGTVDVDITVTGPDRSPAA